MDIDLNYIGAVERETMLADKLKVEQAVQAVCSREGLAVKRVPTDHAGGKWRLTYVGTKGTPGNLELDINFMLRTPLWPCVNKDCHPVGSLRAAPVRMLDLHELTAGKLAALLARSASRDVFDVWHFLKNRWPINKEIVERRTKSSLKDYLEKCIKFVEALSDRAILAGIGELIDASQKAWIKAHLKEDTAFLLKVRLEQEN